MRRRIATMLVITLLFMGTFSLNAFADMGPKPSVHLEFQGIASETCYVTLLSETDTTGPYSVYDASYSVPPEQDREVWQKFVDYIDQDGYYFLQYFQRVQGETDSFAWTYYPPERFKVLVYFPETDTFAASKDPVDTYAFDSYYGVTLTEENTCLVERSYGCGWEIFAFLVRLVLTIAVEVLMALLFGYREKWLLTVILLVNFVTQLGMNILFLVMGYMSIFFFYVLYYAVIELIIVALEGAAYHRTIKKMAINSKKTYHPYRYALAANLCSFLMGYVISHWFPFVF